MTKAQRKSLNRHITEAVTAVRKLEADLTRARKTLEFPSEVWDTCIQKLKRLKRDVRRLRARQAD